MPSVRQATLDDKPAIAEFLRAAYPDRHQYKFPDRWEWQFENNPFRDRIQSGNPNEGKLPIWLAFDGERIIGQTGAQIEPLKLGDQNVLVGWSVDTIVLPEYRRKGIGHRLQQANQSYHQVFMSLAMSDANRRIKTSLGAGEFSPLEVYELRVAVSTDRIRERLRRSETVLAPVATGVGLDRLVAKATTTLARFRWRQAKRRERELAKASAEVAAIREIERFDERFDELWSQVRGHYDMCVERTCGYLNWKFCDQPHARYRRFAALVDDAVVGYVVLRVCTQPEPPLGVIADLVTHDNDESVCRELLVFAVDQLRQAGVEKVRVASTLVHIRQALQSLGFRRIRTYTPMCHISEELRAESGERKAGGQEQRVESGDQSSRVTHHSPLATCHSTFFSLGDHDLDQFPRRN